MPRAVAVVAGWVEEAQPKVQLFAVAVVVVLIPQDEEVPPKVVTEVPEVPGMPEVDCRLHFAGSAEGGLPRVVLTVAVASLRLIGSVAEERPKVQ